VSHPDPGEGPALRLRDVRLVKGDTTVLGGVDLDVGAGQRWVVLGPNGAGKTSLLRIASLWDHPSSGLVEVLGEQLGRVDLRRHRARIGLASHALGDLLRPGVTGLDAVVTARHASLETWWHDYDDADRAAARQLLARFGVAHRAGQPVGTLSSGERQRVLLARAFSGQPGLVLLDKPTAGLDLGGREDLLARLGAVASDPASPPTVLVTHHVEEIPLGTTHALLLRGGRVLARGPLEDVVTESALGELFGLPLRLERRHGRFLAWLA
jgi:iron complex transport system ATP-binding protein